MSEFSDRPFVAGSLFGLRAFRIDQLGRLTGITHKDVWTPGTNEAVCRKTESDMYSGISADASRMLSTDLVPYYATGSTSLAPMPMHTYSWSGDRVEPKKKAKHELAGTSCECGFYAYFDGANDYLRDTAVSTGGYYISVGDDDTAPRLGAIVEGWGVCTVGTRGFRASKARIVGLIAPTSQSARYAVAFDKVRRNYEGVRVFETELDAIAAHPLTDPFPADPSAEDFWTRSAR